MVDVPTGVGEGPAAGFKADWEPPCFKLSSRTAIASLRHGFRPSCRAMWITELSVKRLSRGESKITEITKPRKKWGERVKCLFLGVHPAHPKISQTASLLSSAQPTAVTASH